MNIDNVIKIQEECGRVLAQKNADYGTKNISETGVIGVGVRLLDKVNRILNVARRGYGTVADEGLRDTFLDVANYGLIGMMLIDGTWDEEDTPKWVESVTPPCMVYLAGPVDGISRIDSLGWRGIVGRELAERGMTCYNPPAAFRTPDNGVARADCLRAINRAAIAVSDVVFVNLLGPGRGFGTIREIEAARMLNKPVFVMGEGLGRSLESFDVTLCSNLRACVDAVVIWDEMNRKSRDGSFQKMIDIHRQEYSGSDPT